MFLIITPFAAERIMGMTGRQDRGSSRWDGILPPTEEDVGDCIQRGRPKVDTFIRLADEVVKMETALQAIFNYCKILVFSAGRCWTIKLGYGL